MSTERERRVLAAARKAVALHRGPGGLEDILGALDDLAAALIAVDEQKSSDEAQHPAALLVGGR
jgi:hypothetical protein